MNYKRVQNIEIDGSRITEIQPKSVSTGTEKPEWSTPQITEQLRTGFRVLEADPESTATQMPREEGTNDVGERWVTVRDVEDTKIWASYTNTFNLKGEHRQQDGEFDNGQTWQHIWALDTDAPWFRQTVTTDASDITWWATTTHYINDDGETFAQFGTKDNGETWQHSYDVDGTNSWARLTSEFDSEGRNFVRSGEADSGETWKRQTLSEDRSDLTWWSEHTLYYNDADELYRQTGVKDNTDTWEHLWDVDGTQEWHRQTRTVDVRDAHDWSEQIQTFDASGNLISTFYVDDIA
ncbi:MAG: hypothetical protein HKN05_11345 [Rhizobiales bacterium]|nr:hypothetical protein [Hyphomicrobiales bacterium]